MIVDTGAETPSHLLIYNLGESTNQVAEIWAIGGALSTLRDGYIPEDTEIHIFSDSDFSIKCITGHYASPKHHNIIKHVIALVGLFPRKSVHFHHVAGHAGIAGNETADDLANQGAEISERSLVLHNLPDIAKTYGFNHLLIKDDNNDNGELILPNVYVSNPRGRVDTSQLFN